jgi:hypothetical protein
MELVWLRLGDRLSIQMVDPIWVFLAHRRFAAKTPSFRCLISLDFLGFSRQNLDLSMGYAEKPENNFSSRFCRREKLLRPLAHDLAWRRDGLLMGQA